MPIGRPMPIVTPKLSQWTAPDNSTQWIAPAQEQAAPVQEQYYAPPPVQQNYGGYGGGGYSAPAQEAAPPPPPPPPINYEEVYNTDDKVAGVDSTFGMQRQQYQNALTKYLEDDNRQRGEVTQNANTAREGIARNRQSGLTSLAEDFAARGLGKSGLFLGSSREASDQYARQKTNVDTGETTSLSDLSSRRGKMETDTGNNIAAARREAYARLAAKQELG